MNNKRDWETFIYNYPVDQLPAGIKPANFKAVALAMAYHADWNTLQNMTASMVTIAKDTSLHRNTVDKVVSAMKGMGLVNQREEKRAWGTGTGKWTYVYDLHIPVSHIDVNRLESTEETTEVPVSHIQAPDSHFEAPVSHIDVNNHTYNHTKNHIDDEAEDMNRTEKQGLDSGADAPTSIPYEEHSLDIKENAGLFLATKTGAAPNPEASLAIKTCAAEQSQIETFRLPEPCKHGKDTYCQPCDLEDMADLISLVGCL